MKEFTGFETTEAEFDALPLAVRRKVCDTVFLKEWRNGWEAWEKVVRTIMFEWVFVCTVDLQFYTLNNPIRARWCDY